MGRGLGMPWCLFGANGLPSLLSTQGQCCPVPGPALSSSLGSPGRSPFRAGAGWLWHGLGTALSGPSCVLGGPGAGGSWRAQLRKPTAAPLMWLTLCCLGWARWRGGGQMRSRSGPPGLLGGPSTLCSRPGPRAALLQPSPSSSGAAVFHLSRGNICAGNHLSLRFPLAAPRCSLCSQDIFKREKL